MGSITPKKPWFETKWVVWGAGSLSIIFIGTWLSGKLLAWPWPDGSDWQAIWTFCTFLVAAIAAAVALQQLRAHYVSQREQSRPFVIVDFAFRSSLVSIEVKNIGATPACDVRMEWDVQPVSDDQMQTDVLKRNLVDGIIPFLAPGRAIRYFLAPGQHMVENGLLPIRYNVMVRYFDAAGVKFGPESMLLDFNQWSESLVDSDYENKNWNEFSRQAKAQGKLVEIAKSMVVRLDSIESAIDRVSRELSDDLVDRSRRSEQ